MPAFELENLPYQQDAVRAVVDVFKGSERRATHELAGNRCTLAWAQLSSNLQAVAQRHRISDQRLNLTPPQQGQALDVCVEMETGTGKTLVYLHPLPAAHRIRMEQIHHRGAYHGDSCRRIVRYKLNLFLRCKLIGVVDRRDGKGRITAKRPKLFFSELYPLEKDRTTKTLL